MGIESLLLTTLRMSIPLVIAAMGGIFATRSGMMAMGLESMMLFGAFGINEGLAVDTHVKRISRRLGLTQYDDPVRIERDLMKLFPRDTWGDVNHRLVWFGRDVCDARNPACTECEMAEFCPRVGVKAG